MQRLLSTCQHSFRSFRTDIGVAISAEPSPLPGFLIQVASQHADALILHYAVHGGFMKKFAVISLVALISIASFSASACPKGTHPTGGTGSHHKGGTCS